MHGTNKASQQTSPPPSFTLHYAGSATVLASVVPDAIPGMFRVISPDGTASDMANLSRARDAAFANAARGRDWQRLQWQKRPIENPLGRPPMRLTGAPTHFLEIGRGAA